MNAPSMIEIKFPMSHLFGVNIKVDYESERISRPQLV